MKIRKEKLLWVFYAGILTLLFFASSTDFIIKEREIQVYPISIIIEATADDDYVNFRKGVDLAEAELNADISFITLYDENDAQQQLEMIAREQSDGARALIVSPVEEGALAGAMGEKRVTVPLVLLNSTLADEQICAVITPDYEKMGEELAGKLAAAHTTETPVYLFAAKNRSRISRQFETGVRAYLEERGFSLVLYEEQAEGDFRRIIEELVYPGGDKAVIVALEPESLSETAKILADSSVYASCVEGLYGRGTRLSLLNYLDSGVIRGLCVTDDFSAGYQSVAKAVESITEGNYQHEPLVQEHFYIEKDDLRRKQFEKMLYPIE